MTRGGLSHSGEGTCLYLAVGYTGVRAFGVVAHCPSLSATDRSLSPRRSALSADTCEASGFTARGRIVRDTSTTPS